MEQPPCVLISADYTILTALLGLWTANFALHLGLWTYLLIHNMAAPFIILPPRPTGYLRFSPIAWTAYFFACLIQITVIGSFWYLTPSQDRIVNADMLISMTVVVAGIALFFNPKKVPGLAPAFIWLMWEYVGFVVYLFVFVLHMTSEEREQAWCGMAYHEFVAHTAAYIGVIISAAGLYRANPTYLGMEAISAWDALYFSIATITTTGYGDITPTGCLRIVSSGEMLIGIFIIVLLVGVTVGRIVVELTSPNGAQPPQNGQI